jgi:hypothetical protein
VGAIFIRGARTILCSTSQAEATGLTTLAAGLVVTAQETPEAAEEAAELAGDRYGVLTVKLIYYHISQRITKDNQHPVCTT